MYALHIAVGIKPSRSDESIRLLNDFVVPQMKGTPGFQRGTWYGDGATRGFGVAVYDSQANAEQAAAQVAASDDDPITIHAVEVMTVQAEA